MWFRCFKGRNPPESVKTSLIKEGIQYVYELFKEKGCKLVYLADRWFQNYELMKYIEDLGATYCIRIKSNLSLYIYDYGELAGNIKDIKAKEKEEQYFEKVFITRYRYETKLAVSKKEGHDEAIYVFTNGEVKEGIRNYSYRFGSIECIFKNQKTNGFYLESTRTKNEQAFKTLFGLMSIAILWLILLGIEYTENKVKSSIQIRCEKNKKGKRMSYFKTGLMYFNICFNSYKKSKISCAFVLYEV